MKSKIAKNSFIYTIGQLLPKIGQFFLLPLFTSHLTPSDFGILNNVQVINSILVLFYTLALNRAIFRLYFDFKSEHEKRNYLGTIAIGLAVSTISVTSVFFIFPNILGSVYKNISFYPYFSLSILASAITSFFLIPKTNYFVKEKANIFVLLSLAEFVVRNGMIVLFVIYFNGGVFGYLKGQLLGNVILLPLFIILTLKNINIRFIKSHFINSIKFSLPLLPVALTGWVMNMSDRVFIERIFSTYDVGIYSLGYKIAMLIEVVGDSFYKAYNPYYFKIATNLEKNKALIKLKRTNTLYLLILVVFCSVISLFAKEGIIFLFDDRYSSAYEIVLIISLAYFFGKATGINRLAIYQEKKTIFLLIVNSLGAGLNIILNFILIYRFGAYGAAWATVVTFMMIFFLSHWYAKKCFYASFNHSIVISLFIILLSGNILFYFLDTGMVVALTLKIIFIGLIAGFVCFKYKNVIKELM